MSSTVKSDEYKLIPLESLGSYRNFDPWSEPERIPAFEAPVPEAFAETYCQWKLKQREEKPWKQKRAAEEPLVVRDHCNDPDFDPFNPLGL